MKIKSYNTYITRSGNIKVEAHCPACGSSEILKPFTLFGVTRCICNSCNAKFRMTSVKKNRVRAKTRAEYIIVHKLGRTGNIIRSDLESRLYSILAEYQDIMAVRAEEAYGDEYRKDSYDGQFKKRNDVLTKELDHFFDSYIPDLMKRNESYLFPGYGVKVIRIV
ncbi:MAG: hypothetical protein IJT54_03675 [Candidatus Methanomethylophilaceae archaeon]|nr:hypothetical protein [Candidatus Methanomethylophilaceae archaeon]